MTDKQIIIDNIDVSGCKHYKNRTCIADYCLTDMPFGEAKCELNPNCHYKKWQYKEQECNRLKEEVSLLKESNSKLQQIEDVNSLEKYYLKQINQLKAENDELKRQRQANKGLITATGKMNYQLLQEYDKLKTALTEIKEIAEIRKDDINDWLAKEILQKINEVEDVRN